MHDQGASYLSWQEVLDNGAKVRPDTVVDVWKGGWNAPAQNEMAKLTKAGYHVVLSAPFYLNYIKYGADWPMYYGVEPSNFTGGPAAEASKTLAGLKACLWSEWIDSTNLISRAWPRAAAVAERAWSTKETTDKVDAQGRIHELRCRLLDRGINAEPIGQCTDIGGGCTGTGPQFFPGKAGFCPREWVPV